MTAAPQLILASASPRRRELLYQLGLAFEVCPQDVPEQRAAGETPEDYVRRVARDKAVLGWRRVGEARGLPVLGADTEVVVDDAVLGKPADRAAATGMLALLSGRVHEVLSAVVVVAGERVETRLNRSEVRFRTISAAEAAAYWETGEPQGKAGAYAIQGYGAVFIEELRGSYSGVMGLPLFETAELLSDFGVVVRPR